MPEFFRNAVWSNDLAGEYQFGRLGHSLVGTPFLSHCSKSILNVFFTFPAFIPLILPKCMNILFFLTFNYWAMHIPVLYVPMGLFPNWFFFFPQFRFFLVAMKLGPGIATWDFFSYLHNGMSDWGLISFPLPVVSVNRRNWDVFEVREMRGVQGGFSVSWMT